MDDLQIVALFHSRDARAIAEAQKKYGAYCAHIAGNILADKRDAEETVSDSWLALWNAIPPAKPETLSPFLGRITRNLALNRCKSASADKRGGGAFPLSLDELETCIPDGRRIEANVEEQELAQCISAFLRTEPEEARKMFVLRYFYCESVEDVAKKLGVGQSKVKSALARTRKRLRQALEKEGMLDEG